MYLLFYFSLVVQPSTEIVVVVFIVPKERPVAILVFRLIKRATNHQGAHVIDKNIIMFIIKKFLLIIIIFFIPIAISGCGLQIGNVSTPPSQQGDYLTPQQNNNQRLYEDQGTTPIVPPSPPPIVCTHFEYSNWSRCNKDGEQYRTITKIFPLGCSGGNPIQSQKCEYKPIDVGTAPEILARMINQIRTAPNQTINSSYISGENGELTQKLSYRILDDSLVIQSTLIHRDTNVAESTVDFIDSDLDGFVDYWAGEDRIPHAFDKKSQEYSQMQIIWGVYLINFVNYHLIK